MLHNAVNRTWFFVLKVVDIARSACRRVMLGRISSEFEQAPFKPVQLSGVQG